MVKICKVYTHAPFSVRFLDHDDIGQSLWIINFSDESSNQKLFYLFHDNLVSFKSEGSSFLLDELLGGDGI